MAGSVHERPDGSGGSRCALITSKKARTNAKQRAPPEAQRFGLTTSPRKRLQQRKPAVFQLRQLPAANSPFEQLGRKRLQARLSRQVMTFVEFFEPLTPPGEADRAKMSIAARRDDVSECEVEVPERGKRRPQLAGQLLEGDAPVVIEPALSDR